MRVIIGFIRRRKRGGGRGILEGIKKEPSWKNTMRAPEFGTTLL